MGECCKIIKNPKEEEQHKITALHIVLDSNAAVLDMLSRMKEQYSYSSADAASGQNLIYHNKAT
ncbi:MAG: hypothetical protein ACHQWH_04050 [Nitrososphaerales archaeon]